MSGWHPMDRHAPGDGDAREITRVGELGTPLCWSCRRDQMVFRHRHCPSYHEVVAGTDAKYVDHAWKCEGPA